MEIFSEKCSKTITNFPNQKGTYGRTMSLLDEELIILGEKGRNSTEDTEYVAIQNPRDGLLSMKFDTKMYPLGNIPFRHTSLVSGNALFVIGGTQKNSGKLSGSKWEQVVFRWDEDGSIFDPDFENACDVKVGPNEHVIFGNQVVKINTASLVATRMKPMTGNRRAHSCQLLSDSTLVIISGGVTSYESQDQIQYDELYDIENDGKVFKVLEMQHSLRRRRHVTVKIGHQVFALGGRGRNGRVPSKIKVFDSKTYSWNDFNRNLLSSDTALVIASPFPVTSLDCGCQCGVVNSKERISNGVEAEVRSDWCSSHYIDYKTFFSQAKSHPWIAALLRDKDNKNHFKECSTFQVSKSPTITLLKCLIIFKSKIQPQKSCWCEIHL